MKKVLVSLPEGVFDMVRGLKGELGESDSEVVRNIVIAYLSEQGFFSKMSIRGVASQHRGEHMKKNKSEIREAEDEIDLLDDMLTSLVELLEEKGIITQVEWEKKIEQRIKGKPSTSIRDIKE